MSDIYNPDNIIMYKDKIFDSSQDLEMYKLHEKFLEDHPYKVQSFLAYIRLFTFLCFVALTCIFFLLLLK